MPSKKKSAPPSRQAAYTARNRANLVLAAQTVLAEIGPQATIEQVTEFAQVSPTTIYKYFPNKDLLFAEALSQIWGEWVVWSYNGKNPSESLEVVIDSARKLFWIKQTHPLFAKILHNTLSNPEFIINAVSGPGRKVFKELAARGEIAQLDFDKRLHVYAFALAGLLTAVHVSEEMSPSQADHALGYALRIFDVSETRARKIVTRKLEFPPTK
mgnify:CR=1 FL=1